MISPNRDEKKLLMRFAFPVFNLNIYVNFKQNTEAGLTYLREEF